MSSKNYFIMRALIISPSISASWAAVAWNFWQQTEKQVCCLWTCPPSLSSSLKRCFVLTRVSNRNTRFVLTRGMLEQTTSISEQPQILLSLSPQGSIPRSKHPTLKLFTFLHYQPHYLVNYCQLKLIFSII